MIERLLMRESSQGATGDGMPDGALHRRASPSMDPVHGMRRDGPMAMRDGRAGPGPVQSLPGRNAGIEQAAVEQAVIEHAAIEQVSIEQVSIERVVLEGVEPPPPDRLPWLLASIREELARLAATRTSTRRGGAQPILRGEPLRPDLASGADPHRLGVGIARSIHAAMERSG